MLLRPSSLGVAEAAWGIELPPFVHFHSCGTLHDPRGLFGNLPLTADLIVMRQERVTTSFSEVDRLRYARETEWAVVDLVLSLCCPSHESFPVNDDDIIASIHVRRVTRACALRAGVKPLLVAQGRPRVRPVESTMYHRVLRGFQVWR